MKDQLITIELAKVAKEKWFQNGSFSSYTEFHSDFEYDGDVDHPESHKADEVRLDMNFYVINNFKEIDLSNEHYTLYEAPTLSELQRWLRDTHNIEFVIKPFRDGLSNKTTYTADPINVMTGRTDKSVKGNTYEEALMDGLLKALNLI